MNFSIREATHSDLSEIILLTAQLADYQHELNSYWCQGEDIEAYLAKTIPAQIDNPNQCWFVAEADGGVVGCFFVEIFNLLPIVQAKRMGQISIAIVNKHYRLRGISKKAVEAMFLWLKERDVDCAEVIVMAENESGIAVWENLGFKPYIAKMKIDL